MKMKWRSTILLALWCVYYTANMLYADEKQTDWTKRIDMKPDKSQMIKHNVG